MGKIPRVPRIAKTVLSIMASKMSDCIDFLYVFSFIAKDEEKIFLMINKSVKIYNPATITILIAG